MADFDAALEREIARWAYIGQSAAHLLTGRYEAAHTALAAMREHFPPLRSATTNAYLGELLRLTGELDAAEQALVQAVETKPTRVSSWLNLALVWHQRGDAARCEQALRRVNDGLACVIWEASRERERRVAHLTPATLPALGPAVLETLRGNRSSSLVTYRAAGDATLRAYTPNTEATRKLARRAADVVGR